jgi:uncharacterized C2H2 Zn-finger protein
MDQFNTIFAYSPTHRIAICKSHQQGVVKSQLRTHLDTKHQELVPNTRRQVVNAVDQEASLQAWAMNYEEVIYPRPASQPLPHLPVYHDGLQCNTCAHVYRHIKRMQEHCRQEHGWVNKSQPRGRPASKQTLSLMGERIKVGLGVNPSRNPKYSEVNPLRCLDLWD